MEKPASEQVAWLIEGGNPPFYWLGRGVLTFTSNPDEAVRFARREDADRVIHWVINNIALKAVEHAWTAR